MRYGEYEQGNTAVKAGEYSPGTRGGLEILGHELSHVVQQAKGGTRLPAGSWSSRAGEAFDSGSLTATGPVGAPAATAAAPVQGQAQPPEKQQKVVKPSDG